jgi:hypothetical protein
MLAPLAPTSEPMSIRAPERSVRRTTGWFTPKAVSSLSDMRTVLSPIEIEEPSAGVTIGDPKKRTPRPTETPLRLKRWTMNQELIRSHAPRIEGKVNQPMWEVAACEAALSDSSKRRKPAQPSLASRLFLRLRKRMRSDCGSLPPYLWKRLALGRELPYRFHAPIWARAGSLRRRGIS